MSTDLVGLEVGNINPSSIKNLCGCSLMVELQPSKLTTWVRFPSSAPILKETLFDKVFLFFIYLVRIFVRNINDVISLYTKKITSL